MPLAQAFMRHRAIGGGVAELVGDEIFSLEEEEEGADLVLREG